MYLDTILRPAANAGEAEPKAAERSGRAKSPRGVLRGNLFAAGPGDIGRRRQRRNRIPERRFSISACHPQTPERRDGR